MEVAIALSLLLAESAPKDSPVVGKIFRFHEQPQLLTVPNIPDYAIGEVAEGDLAKRVAWVRNVPWGFSTNFDAVMDLLLELCIQHALPPERAVATKVCVLLTCGLTREAGRIGPRLGRLHTSHRFVGGWMQGTRLPHASCTGMNAQRKVCL